MNKNILRGKNKNNKNVFLPKVPLKSAIKKEPNTEGDKFKHFKEKNNNIDKYNFNAAFAMSHIIKC